MYFPLNVHLEPVFGCNNRCKFCFKQVLDKKNEYEYMSVSTAKRISLQLHDDANIIKFSLRGEPLLNPNIYEIINVIRRHNPTTILLMYTNGKLLSPSNVFKLYDSGLNYIYVDCYNGTLLHYLQKYETFDKVNLKNETWDMYSDANFKENKLIFNEMNGDDIKNHAGNLDFLKYPDKELSEPLNKICLRPFRDIAIYYNGDIGLCCDDGGLDSKLGNINQDSLYEIWNGSKLNSIRRNLLHDRRIDLPCNRCDYID